MSAYVILENDFFPPLPLTPPLPSHVNYVFHVSPMNVIIINLAQVLDTRSESGGVTGWCRAGQKTTCTKGMQETLVNYDINTTLVELFHGTVDRDNPILCVTDLTD